MALSLLRDGERITGAGSPWETRGSEDFFSLDWKESLLLSLFSYVLS